MKQQLEKTEGVDAATTAVAASAAVDAAAAADGKRVALRPTFLFVMLLADAL